jgi:hypothetical protein
MNLEQIQSATLRVLELLKDYAGGHVGRREMLLDPILYGFLEGRFEHLSRQHYSYIHGSARPKRIDFRRGTTNPVVIEFAVRPPGGGGTLYGSQNRTELRKLCRVTPAEARLRVMLLVDLHSTPLNKDNLKATYDDQNSGPGRFQRHSVRVLYVHKDLQFHFLWRP